MRITVIRFFFCLRRTRITVNGPRITHELLYGTLHGALHVDYMWRRRQDFFAFGEHELP